MAQPYAVCTHCGADLIVTLEQQYSKEYRVLQVYHQEDDPDETFYQIENDAFDYHYGEITYATARCPQGCFVSDEIDWDANPPYDLANYIGTVIDESFEG